MFSKNEQHKLNEQQKLIKQHELNEQHKLIKQHKLKVKQTAAQNVCKLILPVELTPYVSSNPP